MLSLVKAMTVTQQSSTKEQILQYLLKQGQATAQELAELLSISPQAIRRHLKDLQEEGYIEYQVNRDREQGDHHITGRPQHLYQLSRKGRDRFPNSHAEFAVSLLDTLAEMVGEDRVCSILQKQWERKAMVYRDRLKSGSLRDRVAALVELRKAEGYMAEWYPVDSENLDTRFVLTEHNCAISDVAESFPKVCGHELEMFATLLPDCTIERTEWMIDGEHRCGYLITVNSEQKTVSSEQLPINSV